MDPVDELNLLLGIGPPKATLPITLQKSGYSAIKQLGKGGFGQAHLVFQKEQRKYFVVKHVNLMTLSSKQKKDAHNEIHILQSLTHPNIVRYCEFCEEHPHLYIVMEYCDGGDLAGHLDKLKRTRQRLSEDQLVSLFAQIGLALKYLHDRRILHRDIKSGNVFLTKTHVVKLGDFGISTVLQSTAAMAKTMCGTPCYFSPELCQGKLYNSKSDIWALGILLYEMAALSLPFEGREMKSLMQTIISKPAPALPAQHYSASLNSLFQWMMEKDPANRPDIVQVLRHPAIASRVPSVTSQLELFAARPSTPVASAPAPGATAAATSSSQQPDARASNNNNKIEPNNNLAANQPAQPQNPQQPQPQQPQQARDKPVVASHQNHVIQNTNNAAMAFRRDDDLFNRLAEVAAVPKPPPRQNAFVPAGHQQQQQQQQPQQNRDDPRRYEELYHVMLADSPPRQQRSAPQQQQTPQPLQPQLVTEHASPIADADGNAAHNDELARVIDELHRTVLVVDVDAEEDEQQQQKQQPIVRNDNHDNKPTQAVPLNEVAASANQPQLAQSRPKSRNTTFFEDARGTSLNVKSLIHGTTNNNNSNNNNGNGESGKETSKVVGVAVAAASAQNRDAQVNSSSISNHDNNNNNRGKVDAAGPHADGECLCGAVRVRVALSDVIGSFVSGDEFSVKSSGNPGGVEYLHLPDRLGPSVDFLFCGLAPSGSVAATAPAVAAAAPKSSNGGGGGAPSELREYAVEFVSATESALLDDYYTSDNNSGQAQDSKTPLVTRAFFCGRCGTRVAIINLPGARGCCVPRGLIGTMEALNNFTLDLSS